MTEATTRRPPDTPAEARRETSSEAPVVGTHVAVWLLYILGIVAATVLLASIVLVAVLSASSSNADLHVSVPVLAFWILLIAAAAVTFLWRRYGRRH